MISVYRYMCADNVAHDPSDLVVPFARLSELNLDKSPCKHAAPKLSVGID